MENAVLFSVFKLETSVLENQFELEDWIQSFDLPETVFCRGRCVWQFTNNRGMCAYRVLLFTSFFVRIFLLESQTLRL